MSKIIVKQGLPGSGKSTSAKEMLDQMGNAGRINFDDLRASMFNSKWSGRREQVVQDVGKAMIQVLLKHNMVPIVDNTNITAGHIERYKTIGRELGAEVEVQRHDASVELCTYRDSRRENPVGRPVIERMALQSGITKFAPEDKLVIVDVDGTLADCRWRQHHVQGEKKDWNAFFQKVRFDQPIEAVMTWVQNLHPEYKIIILSGRDEGRCAKDTVEWLESYQIPFDHILMRRVADKRPDDVIKKEFLDLLPKQQVAFIIDDRNSVCDMWRRVKKEENLNYHIFQVAEGNF
jgi:predicted kinase